MGTRAEVNKITVYYLRDMRIKGAPLRSAAVGEGDGHITAVSVILGDGDRLPNAYIYASQGQNVQPSVMSGPMEVLPAARTDAPSPVLSYKP